VSASSDLAAELPIELLFALAMLAYTTTPSTITPRSSAPRFHRPAM
jgi:hypothetical protein